MKWGKNSTILEEYPTGGIKNTKLIENKIFTTEKYFRFPEAWKDTTS